MSTTGTERQIRDLIADELIEMSTEARHEAEDPGYDSFEQERIDGMADAYWRAARVARGESR